MTRTLVSTLLFCGISLTVACGDDDSKPPDDTGTEVVDADGDGYASDVDCADDDATVHPDAEEDCDGVDNDCDGETDEGVGGTWYADADADGFGDATSTIAACSQPTGYVDIADDCDDHDDDIHPGAVETCDGVDEDCDGEADEGAGDTWYADGDGDGFGDATTSTAACTQPTGYVADATDCDDTSAAVNPAAAELCDGVDNDCDGVTDGEDAVDIATWYADTDGDGYGDAATGATACTQPSGFVADATDCDDASVAVNPAVVETCNGTDDNCDGVTDEDDASDATTWYLDYDDDGYGGGLLSTVGCEAPAHYVADSGDCDDSDGAVNPAAAELCDDVDNDCDGVTDEDDALDAPTWHADADADGYGDATTATTRCTAPSGWIADAADCDDGDDAIFPGADEYCNGTDDDCDGVTDEDDALDTATWYVDADGDGVGGTATTNACSQPSGFVAMTHDCDDSDASMGAWAGEAVFTFTTCGAVGARGPTQTECDSEYAGTTLEGEVSLSAGIQTYVIPCDGLYAIEAAGAQGASAASEYEGGYGAYIYGEVELSRGDVLSIAVGQEGSAGSYNAGGGGGSWVMDAADAPVVVAGGGGGVRIYAVSDGCGGDADEYGIEGSGVSQWSACSAKTTGLSEGGVASLVTWGSAGGGYLTDGASDCDGAGGYSWFNGVVGGTGDGAGGFGGGGSGAGCAGGGGGGGYSGGDGGWVAGGGGSFNAGDSPVNVSADNAGDGTVILQLLMDRDGDGYFTGSDCDDSDPAINPGAAELCDGADNDCDGETDEDWYWYTDGDGDGDGDGSTGAIDCTGPRAGLAATGEDCDDTDPTVYGAAPELCDGVDNDCDGETDEDWYWYADSDGDGWGDDTAELYDCAGAPSGYIAEGGDCDDTNALVYPFGGDTYGDGVDGDCDGFDSEAGWTSSGYFALIPETSISWYDAQDRCYELGYDDLLSIRDAAEMALVLSMSTDTAGLAGAFGFLIGYTDEAREGTWLWTDGATSTYTNWNSGEPNNSGGVEDCAQIFGSTGKWNDVSCTSTWANNGYACEVR